MQHLTQSDFRRSLEFCRSLLAPYQFEDFPRQLLAHLSDVVPSEVSSCVEIDLHHRSVSTLESTLNNAPNLHQAIESTAHRHFHEHPLVANYPKLKKNKAYKISDFLNENELHRRTGLYEQFLQPLGMEDQFGVVLQVPTDVVVQGRLSQPNLKFIGINLYRSDRTFSERDRTMLNLLSPHVVQACQNAIALTQSQRKFLALQQTIEQLGLIGISETGQAEWISDRAWSFLKHYDLTSTHQKGRVSETLERWIKHQIRLCNQSGDVPQPLIPLSVEQGDHRLIVRFVHKTIASAQSDLFRLDVPYLLLIEEEALPAVSAQSLEVLGLTQRESEVLYWLIQDKQNSEIATLLEMQTGTLKKHLEHIYSKLGVQTRTGAILCALERLGLLR